MRRHVILAGALLALGGMAGAHPVEVGASVGLPRADIVPVDLSVTSPLLNAGDATVWGRADVTFGLGTTLTPAFGASLIAQPAERYGAFRPFVGAGATTISSTSGLELRPVVLAGLQTRFDRLGVRLDGAMIFTDYGPRVNAALGLTYRFDLGGSK
ncbi:hypothetical protein HNQ07_004364 [Deinococcus metalli]|uniref:Outer membrane protein beta-barrel domain-containing protein n=1 Tax=Deinococcus metalli TaxID=1141878 RepID=A0A7W8KIQ6_9DEIO|nr:hypothetical protein [Deinococcus metalli]MBB5378857.1 hypothetical protein [Deinococcus metalli]GHF62212.1 hypothetical protein GCM10017781_42870 [Deinococcus metalli]